MDFVSLPEENAKLRANPGLIPRMVSETIRWQIPLAHMARRATRDAEVNGKVIPKGDRVAMWYVSGNRDEAEIENVTECIIDRKNPRHHLSFGFCIHRDHVLARRILAGSLHPPPPRRRHRLRPQNLAHNPRTGRDRLTCPRPTGEDPRPSCRVHIDPP